MIKSLYSKFQYLSEKGSIYIISDTHFDDFDCKYMDPNWVTPEEHIEKIKKIVNKGNNTLIHLGDVGNPKYLEQIRAYKVLITGNHDVSRKVSPYFDEVYNGPLFIADRILLSHEPIYGLEKICVNIHGHDHSKFNLLDINHINLASNVYDYNVFNLKKEIEKGLFRFTQNYHRITIDNAKEKSVKNG